MTTEYLGNDMTKYSLDSGKVITLSDVDFDELGTQNKLYIAMREENLRLISDNQYYIDELSEKDKEIYTLERELHELKAEIRDTDNMTVEQFDNIAWKAGLKVVYRRNEYDVASVDLEKKEILIVFGDTGAYVPCTQCKLAEDKEDENLYLILVSGIWQKTTKQMYQNTTLPKKMIVDNTQE